MLKVKKRNGHIVDWDTDRIILAVNAANCSVGRPMSYNDVSLLAEDIEGDLTGEVGVEEIQDMVEERLMRVEDFHKVAKAYILYRQERKDQRFMDPDSNLIAEYITVSKYSQHLNDEQRRETFDEVVDRVEGMHLQRFPDHQETIKDAFKYVREKKVLPSMRSMQFGGSAIQKNHARMYNCSYSLCNRRRFFGEALFLLLSGCGTGFNIRRDTVAQLPKVRQPEISTPLFYTIPNSIEGWADALDVLMESYETGAGYIEFDYSEIWPKGYPLNHGGTAPGHVPLKTALEAIRKLMDKAVGRKLTTVEACDIVCHSAKCVLAGGIRRSSCIALFDIEDTAMFEYKAKGEFRPAYGADEGINDQRQMVNISAYLTRGKVENYGHLKEIMDFANTNYGDPGFYYVDFDGCNFGCNPCGEIGMDALLNGVETGWSFCNLTEINAATVTDEHDFYLRCTAASVIGTLQATYTDFPYLERPSKAICERDALLGVSLTGIQDNYALFDNDKVLPEGARVVVNVNNTLAKELGINPAARCTTMKPSGTASQVLKSIGSGGHPRYAKHYYRRVTANPSERIAQAFKEANPHLVEVKPDGDWSLIFPCKAPEGATTWEDIDALEFVKRILNIYERWVRPGTVEHKALTHNVSCTVTLKRDDNLDDVLEVIAANESRIGAMSFCPYDISGVYPFPPFGLAKNVALWNDRVKKMKPVNWLSVIDADGRTPDRTLDVACGGGACEI